MSAYEIITDSSCDFTAQQYKDLALTYAPLSLLYRGETHNSFTEEADLKAFYDGIREGQMPVTSAVNPQGWRAIMEPILGEGRDILCLAFSSGLSTTYQSAVIAANELLEEYPSRSIRVVDTLCAALGQGLLVWHTCRKRNAGLSLEELTAWVEENKLHLIHWFTVDDLNHLKRGGRVSAATALVGGMLNIKPVMRMSSEGKLEAVSKVRGRKASIEALAEKVALLGDGWDNETVFIAHGDCLEDARLLETLVRQKCPFVKNVEIGYVGGVIGAHTGPGVLAMFFLGRER